MWPDGVIDDGSYLNLNCVNQNTIWTHSEDKKGINKSGYKSEFMTSRLHVKSCLNQPRVLVDHGWERITWLSVNQLDAELTKDSRMNHRDSVGKRIKIFHINSIHKFFFDLFFNIYYIRYQQADSVSWCSISQLQRLFFKGGWSCNGHLSNLLHWIPIGVLK